MKKIKWLNLIVFIAVACISLTACGSFEGYDDDAAIIRASSFSTVKSVSSQTATKFSLKCDKSNGVKKIENITIPENPVFDMTLTVDSGRFKVVLVKDGSVFVICDGNTAGPVHCELSAGKYSLRIVAENAKINFTFKFDSYK